MKREYDFSKAEREKFYRRGAKMTLPIYLHTTLFRYAAPNRNAPDLGQVGRDSHPRDPAAVRMGADQGSEPTRLALSGVSDRLPHRLAQPDGEAQGRYALGGQAHSDRRPAASYCADGRAARA